MANGYSDLGARIDASGLYRYELWRAWEGGAGSVLFVMLNPSTADGTVDDPTIRKCVRYAKAWGYQRLEVANLFAFRSSDPGMLSRAADPVGPENDAHIEAMAARASLVVAAWGDDGTHLGRGDQVVRMLSRLGSVFALRVSRAGQPRHPRFIKEDTRPQLLRGRDLA